MSMLFHTKAELSFVHSGHIGDIIYSLACVQDILQRQKVKKCNYYVKTNLLAIHPIHKDASGSFLNSLLPLLSSQSYISCAEAYANQEIDFQLDDFRNTGFNLGVGHIGRWYNYCFLCNPDLSKPFLEAEPSDRFKGKIICNRTQRYRNGGISYHFLKGRNDVVFFGLPEEYRDFAGQAGPVEYVQFSSFLDIAKTIAGCRFFIGNQSSLFAVAESLKVPRILEVFLGAPNVVPHGPDGWDVINQNMMEKVFNLLDKKL